MATKLYQACTHAGAAVLTLPLYGRTLRNSETCPQNLPKGSAHAGRVDGDAAAHAGMLAIDGTPPRNPALLERSMNVGVIARVEGHAAESARPAGVGPPIDVTLRLAEAEAQGYAAAWLRVQPEAEAELLLSAARVAVRTRTIALGIVGSLTELLHPLRVAEDLAVIVLMCDGRLSWALPAPLRGAGRDAALAEVVEIVRMAWSGQAFSHTGDHYSVPELICHPTPARAGGPALYEAASKCADDATQPAEGAAEIFVACHADAQLHEHVIVATVVCDTSDASARARAEALPGGAQLAGDPARVRAGIEALAARVDGDSLVLIDPAPVGIEAEAAAESQRRLAEALFR